MKVLKRLCYLLMALLVCSCGLIILCAAKPEVTEAIAQFLYPEQAAGRELPEPNLAAGAAGSMTDNILLGTGERPGPEGEGSYSLPDAETAGAGGLAGESGGVAAKAGDAGLSENISPEYVPPSQSDIHVPEKVSGRNGYRQVQGGGEQIGEDAAKLLQNQIGPGETGEGLNFDVVYYPYYSMMDDTGKRLYRQIYANANALIGAFSPVEEISAAQLKNVFYAVFNDHPELFWLETAYFCKYTKSGRCVEIDLRFNRTAQDLEGEKALFNENANGILAQVNALGNQYEKEKLIHNLLIDKVSYDLGAEMNQSAYSALVNGRSVCAGYTRAYQYLMQQAGIPCYYCTGYAGENHAWNIVMLEDGFYNVDTTWDDTEGGNYDYFNRTDQDYADTHVRQELSVYLPSCNGQQYRGLEQPGEEGLRSLEELGMPPESVLYSISEYYDDCYRQITEAGRGTYEFYNVIEGEALLEEWKETYQGNGYKQGYAQDAMTAVGATACEMSLDFEELQGGRYLVIHSVDIQ